MSSRQNSSNGSQESVAGLNALLNAPGLALSQKMALETAKFSALRMRAYAAQMEALARCANPADMIAINAQFLQQAQADYVAQTQTVREILTSAAPDGAAH